MRCAEGYDRGCGAAASGGLGADRRGVVRNSHAREGKSAGALSGSDHVLAVSEAGAAAAEVLSGRREAAAGSGNRIAKRAAVANIAAPSADEASSRGHICLVRGLGSLISTIVGGESIRSIGSGSLVG